MKTQHVPESELKKGDIVWDTDPKFNFSTKFKVDSIENNELNLEFIGGHKSYAFSKNKVKLTTLVPRKWFREKPSFIRSLLKRIGFLSK